MSVDFNSLEIQRQISDVAEQIHIWNCATERYMVEQEVLLYASIGKTKRGTPPAARVNLLETDKFLLLLGASLQKEDCETDGSTFADDLTIRTTRASDSGSWIYEVTYRVVFVGLYETRRDVGLEEVMRELRNGNEELGKLFQGMRKLVI